MGAQPFICSLISRKTVLSRTLDEIHIRVLAKAIISTPYWHAAELLDDGRGALVPFNDSNAIASATIELLDNEATRHAMRTRAYLYARHMVWDRVAQSYMRAFVRARANRMQPAGVAFPLQAGEKKATSRLINF